jgi:hypothetical protein
VVISVGFALKGAVRFEYVRVSPYAIPMSTAPGGVTMRTGYRACVAAAQAWNCRDFRPTESPDPLHDALVALGNDGWELVSVANEEPTATNPNLTYWFKRQAR